MKSIESCFVLVLLAMAICDAAVVAEESGIAPVGFGVLTVEDPPGSVIPQDGYLGYAGAINGIGWTLANVNDPSDNPELSVRISTAFCVINKGKRNESRSPLITVISSIGNNNMTITSGQYLQEKYMVTIKLISEKIYFRVHDRANSDSVLMVVQFDQNIKSLTPVDDINTWGMVSSDASAPTVPLHP
jgi:hypothetical protein